jgi:hypothetical protein
VQEIGFTASTAHATAVEADAVIYPLVPSHPI